MTPTVRPTDALLPAAQEALDAWAARVRADREQVHRLREVEDPSDFYAPVADRFRLDPRRTDDPTLEVLRSLARPDDTWLDIGAGGGRFALPLALIARRVVAIEPSDAMLTVLRGGMDDAGIRNVDLVAGRWPDLVGRGEPGMLRGDVSLIAHVGYDIERIGPFLDAMEAATDRLCVAVMGESAMTTVASRFWEPVHGEARVRLPALPELVTLLHARGRIPEVRLVERQPPRFDGFDELLAMARRQLWVRPGSPSDERLSRLLPQLALERDGRWSLDEAPSRVGIVSWEPARSGPAVVD